MTNARSGFTLIEVLMAMFILVLFPAGALMTTIRLEKHARTQSELMAASAFCEDIYARCLREEEFEEVAWKSLSGSNADRYVKVGVATTSGGASADNDNKIYLPAVRLKDGSFYSPLVRDGYSTPKYRIAKKGTHDVRVSLRWGAKLENYYHK